MLFVIAAGNPPIVTEAPLRSVPVITTLVPPDVKPVVGESDETTGDGSFCVLPVGVVLTFKNVKVAVLLPQYVVHKVEPSGETATE